MKVEITDILFYLGAFSLILLLTKIGEKNKFAKYLGLLLLMVLSVVRYDIGNDYMNYVFMVKRTIATFRTQSLVFAIKDTFLEGCEPLMLVLCFVFKDTPSAFVYVIGGYAILTILLWNKALTGIQHGLFWGLFIIFTYGLLFNAFDQIRQILAASIFLYSYRYITARDWKKYLICIALGVCCHYSILLVSWAYFMQNVRPRIKWYLVIVAVFYLGYMFGVWDQFRQGLFSMVSLYDKYATNKRQLGAVALGSGLGFLLRMLILVVLMVRMGKKQRLLCNMLFLGIIINCFASGNLNINRMAYYFTFAMIPAFPLFMSYERNKILKASMVLGLLASMTYNMTKTFNGNVPYDSIFGQRYEHHSFRIREYMK